MKQVNKISNRNNYAVQGKFLFLTILNGQREILKLEEVANEDNEVAEDHEMVKETTI